MGMEEREEDRVSRRLYSDQVELIRYARLCRDNDLAHLTATPDLIQLIADLSDMAGINNASDVPICRNCEYWKYSHYWADGPALGTCSKLSGGGITATDVAPVIAVKVGSRMVAEDSHILYTQEGFGCNCFRKVVPQK